MNEMIGNLDAIYMKLFKIAAVFSAIILNCMATGKTDSDKGKPITGLEVFYLDAPAQTKLEQSALAGDAQSALRLSKFYRFIKKDLDSELVWLERAYAIDHNSQTKCELGVTLIYRAKRDFARAKILLQEASKEGVKSADSWLKETYKDSP